MSVTSSGRSPIKAAIKCTCGKFCEIPAANSFKTVVLPAFGGDTIMPRCPKPIGAIKSIILVDSGFLPVVKMTCFLG